MNRRIARAGALAVVALMAAAPAAAHARITPVDRAFVREMIPHHRMAVDMAEMAQMHATHARLKTLGASIVEDQNAEIREMRAIAERLKVKPLASGHEEHEAMMRDAETLGLTMERWGWTWTWTSSTAPSRSIARSST